VRLVGRVTVALGGVELAAYLATVVAARRTYGILRGVYLGGPNVVAQVRAMRANAVVQVLLSVTALLTLVGAAVSLLSWVWRARGNAELIEPGRRFHFAAGFTPWSFLVPVANLWWSRRVFDEIWAASRPGGRGDGQLVRAWWLCQLGSVVVNLLVSAVTGAATPAPDPAGGGAVLLAQLLLELRNGALTSTTQLGTSVAAGAPLGAIVPRISRWQSDSVPAGEL
jgi:hypothetical protein